MPLTKPAAKTRIPPSGNPGSGTRSAATITRSTGTQRSIPAKGLAPFNWKKFWIEVGVYVLIFNIVAGLITWYFIFPKLHLR